jgi:hypothetical protein
MASEREVEISNITA